MARRGIDATVARGVDVGERLLAARRGAFQVTVPAVVREQVQIELLRLNIVEDVVDWLLRDLATGRDPRADSDIAYDGELDVWEGTI
jgi:hypothetical protein